VAQEAVLALEVALDPTQILPPQIILLVRPLPRERGLVLEQILRELLVRELEVVPVLEALVLDPPDLEALVLEPNLVTPTAIRALLNLQLSLRNPLPIRNLTTKSLNLRRNPLSPRRRRRNLRPPVVRYSRRTAKVSSVRRSCRVISRSSARKRSCTTPRRRMASLRSSTFLALRLKKEILMTRRTSSGSNFPVTRRKVKIVSSLPPPPLTGRNGSRP
jgi:hypothetical protein